MIFRAMESSIMINCFLCVKHNVIKTIDEINHFFAFLFICILGGFPAVKVASEHGATLAQCLSGSIKPQPDGI